MIQFLQNSQIDFEKWDRCIDEALNGLIYPYSYFLDQVSPGWCALVEDDYKVVMPVPVKRKWGFSYVMQPMFVQQLGLFSAHPIGEDLMGGFMQVLTKKFSYIHYSLNTFNPLMESIRLKATRGVTYELDLIPDYDTIYRSYSTNTKRNLKKSQRHKVFVASNGTPEPVITSFRQNRGKNIGHMQEEHYNTLKHLIYSLIHRGKAIVYSAYTAENTFCAGAVFFHSHQKSIFIFSGNTPEARENGAMTAIMDAYIRDYCQRELTLDFEGSSDPSLARFYAGFGAQECEFFQLKFNNFPLLLKKVSDAYLKWRKSRLGH